NNQETTLYSFMGGPTDGKGPYGPLTQVGSTIYGTTLYGGENGDGTIFALNANPYNGVSIVHSFSGTAADGYGPPQGNLVSVGSTLYGLNELGDDVFAYSTANNTVSPVAYLNGNDGENPHALTESTQSSSIFYGTASGGGSADEGALFELNLASDQIIALHSFLSIPYDGVGPLGPVIQSGDMLYGETSGGGDAGGGVIFSYDLDNGAYTILHNFGGSGGAGPNGGLLLDGNTLYGITEGGGTNGNDGVIFSYVLPEPGTFTLIAGVAGCGLLRRRR
ncbi:MAG TPA: choice-of-anchor tandem repeat GloVer-containing protein, partial [Tepidisphaeraceae bacterium]|nr:choice-of-anchor tandem repeat GloVer-containing protein [Tepidisphaeraceae bacterium]